MTSTPVSLKDGSLEGSWVDVGNLSSSNNQSNESLVDCRSSPFTVVDPAMLSYQVQRFLQESQRTSNTGTPSNAQVSSSASQQNLDHVHESPYIARTSTTQTTGLGDGGSLINLYDDEEYKDNYEGRVMMNSLRFHCTNREQTARFHSNISLEGSNTKNQHAADSQQNANVNNNYNTTTSTCINNFHDLRKNKDSHIRNFISSEAQELLQNHKQTTPKNLDNIQDQLSDSLSLLSRASGMAGNGNESSFTDLDWLWDWTAQPEYFGGQEWKVYAPKQEYLMRQRQLYRSGNGHNSFNNDVASLLVLTNVLSIIIGAGLTYGILARKNGV